MVSLATWKKLDDNGLGPCSDSQAVRVPSADITRTCPPSITCPPEIPVQENPVQIT